MGTEATVFSVKWRQASQSVVLLPRVCTVMSMWRKVTGGGTGEEEGVVFMKPAGQYARGRLYSLTQLYRRINKA